MLEISKHKSNEIIDAYVNLVNSHDRPTYHLTMTYQDRKCFENPTHENKQLSMSSIFSTFYLCRLLPYIMNTTKFTKVSIKHLQPISLVFPERHKDRFTLHHHAVICAHQETVSRLDKLLERELKNDFDNFRHIESVYLTKRDSSVIKYASKEFHKFHDDVLIFAPRFLHYSYAKDEMIHACKK